MDASAKYLIHADVTADGVVERADVVGAVYGQTEGLLGEQLDLRYLQEASKVGRIDVDVESEGGRSFGEVTIASSMDRVETAVLAASLETIGRVGPCRAEFRVTGIEDVRAAKRREVVDRAVELLEDSFDEPAASSREILEEVRQEVRVADITEYEGLPAGPNVADSDAVVVVEGRADVQTLLRYGVKNAVAVEGTDVPDAVAALTRERTTTAFLDGDRGGDLILKELAQVGDVDHVALAPPDRGVEDLTREEVRSALRRKVPYEQLAEGDGEPPAVPTDGGTVATTDDAPTNPSADDGGGTGDGSPSPTEPLDGAATDVASPVESSARAEATGPGATGAEPPTAAAGTDDVTADDRPASHDAADGSRAADDAADDSTTTDDAPDGEPSGEDAEARDVDGDTAGSAAGADLGDGDVAPETLAGHVEAALDAGEVRLLDESFGLLSSAPADEAFEAVESADPVPATVVLAGTLTQRVLDVAAQRGVDRVVARETGDLVKQPATVRLLTVDQVA